MTSFELQSNVSHWQDCQWETPSLRPGGSGSHYHCKEYCHEHHQREEVIVNDHSTTGPHRPHLEYLCPDPECCDNGCPHVSCRACHEDWPCADWRSRHTASQVRAQVRYVERKWWPESEGWTAEDLDRQVDRKVRQLEAPR